jgi:hypothetical protein
MSIHHTILFLFFGDLLEGILYYEKDQRAVLISIDARIGAEHHYQKKLCPLRHSKALSP